MRPINRKGSFLKTNSIYLFFCRDTYHEELANEFLGFFDFTNHSLDESLRTFLSQVSLTQDVQEREVVLQHFTKRYLQCNPQLYTSKTFLSEGELHQVLSDEFIELWMGQQ